MQGVSSIGTAFLIGMMAVSQPIGQAVQKVSVITMENWPSYYRPSTVHVLPHAPIRWVNDTASPHSVLHDGCFTEKECAFRSGPVFPGQSYALSGLLPGRYPYHCEIHPIMRGEIIVGDLFSQDSESPVESLRKRDY